MNKLLLILIFIIITLGLVILSSAGIIDSQKKFGSSYYYLTHQILYGLLPGLVLMFLFAKIDYKFWKKISLVVLLGALALMILVFIPPFGQGLKGATRWLNVWGVSFQPSEALKLSLIIYLASWFGNRDERIKNWTYGAAPFFIVLAFIGLLLALQPDIGTLIIVTFISLALYFFAGANIKHLLIIGLIIISVLAVVIALEPYRFNRIKAFIDPSIDPRGISYQVNQSMISIGSGGLFGVGFGKSTQKFGFLPEVVNDSIFAVIVEELGFVGASVIISTFLILVLVLVFISKNISDKFGKFIVLGMAAWIISQTFINIAAVSGLVPLTGIPLPFISYGGTAMMSLLAGIGIVLNIARKT